MPSEQFLKTHWHLTNKPRWINTRHIVWFAPTVEPDAGADVFLMCDDDSTHEFIAVNETPEELVAQLAALTDPGREREGTANAYDELVTQLTALIDQQSPGNDPAHD